MFSYWSDLNKKFSLRFSPLNIISVNNSRGKAPSAISPAA